MKTVLMIVVGIIIGAGVTAGLLTRYQIAQSQIGGLFPCVAKFDRWTGRTTWEYFRPPAKPEPIRVQMPGGETMEFPQGMSQSEMQEIAKRFYSASTNR